jgi:hypothetical protein
LKNIFIKWYILAFSILVETNMKGCDITTIFITKLQVYKLFLTMHCSYILIVLWKINCDRVRSDKNNFEGC